MRITRNRLIVVLGMHRSVTSAITRGLQVFGVDLGARLMPAVEGKNAKGFWEDIDLNALNIDLLHAVGSNWSRVSAIDSTDVDILHKQGYFLRAVELLREKVSNSPIFAFKDPRMAKLLPFWKEVFARCQLDVSYVLAVRHPLSVVKSLTKRDGLDAEHCCLLWMGHVITSLTYSADKKRVLVDYDRLMHSPDYELNRIAKNLNLEVDPAALQSYKTEFLDGELRHTFYNLNDFLLDDTCSPIVQEIYSALLDVASDNVGFDALATKVAQWSVEFEHLKSPLMLIDKLLAQKVVTTQIIDERDGQISNLNQAVSERDGQISNLNQAVSERDGQIGSLNQAVTERDVQIAALNYEVVARDVTIRAIQSSFSWRLTCPLRRVFAIYPQLRIVARRAVKLFWWVLTLQLVKRMREWRLSRNTKGNGGPHFAPLSDDYCFAIPFNYPIEKPTVTPNVAVVCHMYYPEMLDEFKRYLSNIPFPFDLFITTDSEEKKNDITTGLLDWNMGTVEIRLAPNRGRDIAPKLITCRDVYERYEFFLHIHSKKSPHHHSLEGWRSYLLGTLLGSREIVESIFEAFNSDPMLGLIAPQHYNSVKDHIGWGWNFDAAKKFAIQLGMKLSIDEKVDFPSGSMFWGRSAAIKPLLESGLALEDFPTEASQIDGTLGHIIERIYFFVCEQAGYRWLKIACPALMQNAERMIFCESKASLVASIKDTQYGLLVSSKERPSGLFKLDAKLGSFAGGLTQSWRMVHSKSDLRTMVFSQFCDELEKHISKQESKIDFDENSYLSANQDVAAEVAKGCVSCGYAHYCLYGQYEGRMHSDRQLKHRLSINPSYPSGFLAPIDYPPLRNRKNLTQLPQSPRPFLLILFSHLQEDLFFAGYSDFFKDHISVFDHFDRVIIAVENAEFDRKLALRYLSRIEVIHSSEIGALKYKPDIIIGFNAHLTCTAYLMLPDNPERVVYYCQDFESGFFSYGADYIIGEKAISGSRNLIVSTTLLRKFLVNRGLVNDAQQVFVTNPKIEVLDVQKIKTNRLFFYYRPESFNKRNLPEALMAAVREFCFKYSDYEIYMVGSVATSYSFKINGTQVFVISKLPKKDYDELISSCDVVVAMIYSAHPGVIAFQAAASGIPTITNVFENRDASLLKDISANIVPYDPVRDSLLVAIEQALAMPKGQPSFDEALYSGNQQGSLVDFYDNILHCPSA